MKNKQTHAFGVPLRVRKFRRQVRIGTITHAYNRGVYMHTCTLCGINYTHKKYRVGDGTMLASRTATAVDCMSCLVKTGVER